MNTLQTVVVGIGWSLPLVVATGLLMKIIHSAQIYFNREKTGPMKHHD